MDIEKDKIEIEKEKIEQIKINLIKCTNILVIIQEITKENASKTIKDRINNDVEKGCKLLVDSLEKLL